MKILFVFACIIISTLSCTIYTKKKAEAVKEAKSLIFVGSKEITNEIAGSAYRKRATQYFIVNEVDTSSFKPIVILSNSDASVRIRFDIGYRVNDLSYADRLSQLKTILKKASQDYNLDSLKYVGIGRLVLHGDMTAALSASYIDLYGDKGISVKEYGKVCAFLSASQLSIDLNNIFTAYNIEIESYSIEKAFFTSRKVLKTYSKLDNDTINIPEKILDCDCWIQMKKSSTL